MLRQVDVHLAESHDRTWKLNCTVWALVDQQDKRRQYAHADSSVIEELSVQVRKYK